MKLESGSYLKTADVTSGESITFRNEGEWVENTKFTWEDGTPKQDFVILVTYKGNEKKLRLNKTNREAMKTAYGDETREWIGKPAILTKEKMLVAGKRMDCITLEAPGGSKPMTEKEKADAQADLAAEQEKEIPF